MYDKNGRPIVVQYRVSTPDGEGTVTYIDESSGIRTAEVVLDGAVPHVGLYRSTQLSVLEKGSYLDKR